MASKYDASAQFIFSVIHKQLKKATGWDNREIYFRVPPNGVSRMKHIFNTMLKKKLIGTMRVNATMLSQDNVEELFKSLDAKESTIEPVVVMRANMGHPGPQKHGYHINILNDKVAIESASPYQNQLIITEMLDAPFGTYAGEVREEPHTFTCDICSVNFKYHPWHHSLENNRHIHMCSLCHLSFMHNYISTIKKDMTFNVVRDHIRSTRNIDTTTEERIPKTLPVEEVAQEGISVHMYVPSEEKEKEKEKEKEWEAEVPDRSIGSEEMSKVITLNQWGGIEVSFHKGFDVATEFFGTDMGGQNKQLAYACTVEKDGILSVAIISRHPWMSVDSISHECLHAAWRVLGALDISVDSGNHEALAYLMDYLVAEAVEFWGLHA